MKRPTLALLALLGWCVTLLGCPPTVPNVPLSKQEAKRRTPVRAAKRRKVAKRVVKRRVEPRFPRNITRGKNGRIKSALPANLRRYARRGGRVKAVYYEKNQKPNPLAQKLCHALHVLPKKRRMSCCKDKFMLFHPGKECVRTLTAAVLSKALKLVKPNVMKCIAALNKLYEGCGWIGYWPPKMPPVCYQITVGSIKKGKMCRSSLECADKMYCHALGSTVAGRCWTSLPSGQRCGTGIDPLGVYLRQNDLSIIRSQCQGACVRTYCVNRVDAGKKCANNRQCQPGFHCGGGKCVKGKEAQLGRACKGRCSGALRCLKGVCRMPKKAGVACTYNDECKGACLKKKGQKAGICGMQCSLIRR